MSSAKQNNINWLASCRGLAATGVVLTHFLPQIDNALGLNSKIIRAITVDYFDVGKIGVALLFIISGFLTPSSKRRRTAAQFAFNRFIRLYPMYWLSIILAGLLFSFNGFDMPTVLANFTMLQIFFGKEDIIGVFWTLPIELMLYAGAILFEKLMWDGKKLMFIYVPALAGTLFLSIIRRYVFTGAPVAIGLLLSAALLGQYIRLCSDGAVSPGSLVLNIALFEAALLASSFLAYNFDTGYNENWHRYVASYTIAVAVFIAMMKFDLSFKPLSLIGAVSYPLYLLQELVFGAAFGLHSENTNTFIFVLLTFTVLGAVSAAAHIIIESPLTSVGKKAEEKMSPRK